MFRARLASVLCVLLAVAASAAEGQVVISQIYGGGNNSGATYQNDFIELFNAGSSAQSLDGWSVQYTSSAGTSWTNLTALPNVTLQPGHYYLIEESGGTTNGVALPTADLVVTVNPINLSGTNGKVALVDGATAIASGTSCPSGETILDFVGYGTANCPNPAGGLGNTTAAIRKGAGCTNSGNNTDDFDVATPTPRNTSSTATSCAVSPTLTVTAPLSIPEGNAGTSIATFTVTLDSPAPPGGVSFQVDTGDAADTATGGSDYQTISADNTHSIAAGDTSTTIDVTIDGDTIYEGNETFSVKLSNITNATNATASAVGTIVDDDPQPTVTVAGASVIEGNSGDTVLNFPVTLSNASAFDVSFTVDTSDGTATTADNDYDALVAQTITITAGNTSGSIPVTVHGDTNIEPDETFTIALSAPTGGSLGDPNTATGTITNDDAVTPTISINNVMQAEGDSGTSSFTFTVSSNVNAPAGGYTVTIATADGTATAGEDYVATAPATTVTIPEGTSTVPFAVSVNGDRKIEPNETFSVSLSNPPDGTQLGIAVGTGTIVNDDVAPTLSVADASISEGDSGTQALNFTVHLSGPATQGGVQFDVTTLDGTATTADQDYVAKTQLAQTIAEGQQDFVFAVTINGDTKFEADETFSVKVNNITGVSNAGATVTATGTILNDDAKPTLSVADVSVMEGNSGTNPAVFTAQLSSPAPAGGVTFKINTADGTATTADHDYVALVNANGSIAAGATSTTFTVTVNSDAIVEPNETFSVNLSAITNTSNTTVSATGTILNDDGLSIMEIQGHGTTSPFNGHVVKTAGNVVTAKKSNGFFMQNPYGDDDPTTSDGIFVFTSSAPAVQVGNEVTVNGTVQEFSGSTEISGTPTVTVTNANAPVQPVAYVLDSSPPTNDPTTGICMGRNSTINIDEADADGYQASNFACLDGMLVTINDATVTGATFGNGASDGVHTGTATGLYAMVSGGPRPFRGPGALYPGFGAGIPVWNGEPEVIEIYYPGLSFSPTGHLYDAGARVTINGVLQGFQASGTPSPIYEVYPYAMADVAPAPTYPQAVADSAEGTLTIGSQNLLHFFNATADGADTSGYNDTCAGTGSSDTCPTPAEYATRLAKWTKQVCEVLKAPVVLDIEEIENLSVAHDLAASVQSACAVNYQAYLMPGNDVSGINIGILVRDDVVVDSVTQMFKNTATANCSGTPGCLLNDRPPVLMQASWNGYKFALLAIYDRSLSGLGDPTKPYIGPKRAEQAAQIAYIAQAWQSGATLLGAGNAQQAANGTITQGSFDIVGDATVPLIIAGDFNAYEFGDGYADVTGMITGNAVQSQNLYWYDGSAFNPTPAYAAPNPTLVDSGVFADPVQRYSYNFSGMAQEIDHVVLSRQGLPDFVRISNAHGNADVSEASSIILDATTAARSGDHDGQVLTIAIDRVFSGGFDPQP
ncbi:MAG TPA: Calx-beta domain-containing protein [Rudaea sp.]|jgi:predicted extracellular nuclease